MDLFEGIGEGQVVRPDHITRALSALTGKLSSDYTLKGVIFLEGPTKIDGNLSVSEGITGSNLYIKENKVQLGDYVKISDVNTNVTDLYSKNHTISNNLIISGGITFKDVPNKQNSTTFLSLNNDGTVTKTTGSLREKITPVDIYYKFSNNLLEDEYTFKGIINDLDIYSTQLIDKFHILSKLDNSPSWVTHKNIKELQQWININIMGDRLTGNIFWIKINVEYKSHEQGKSQVVLRYTNT